MKIGLHNIVYILFGIVDSGFADIRNDISNCKLLLLLLLLPILLLSVLLSSDDFDDD